MFRYIPFEEILCSDELGSYISFGIKAVDDLNNSIISVSDVSTNESVVADLCNCCTLYRLHPIHLLDIIDDFI